MRNPTPGATPPSGNNYSPSVPISVYRELAAELQATKAMLDSLNSQNQRLTQQNQQLQQEVGRVVQSALHLQQVVDSFQSNRPTSSRVSSPMDTPSDLFRGQSSRPSSQPIPSTTNPVSFPPLDEADPLTDALFSQQEEPKPRLTRSATAPKDMGGLWLTITITVIIITAFGAGFLVVRPLLPSSD